MRIQAQSVDDYIALQPATSRWKLERVRQTIRKALPEAVECISYSMPAYRLNNRIVLYFAGWAEHYSLYQASDAMAIAFDGALDAYRASKGTLRFALTDPIPTKLIQQIAKFRAAAITADNARPRKTATSPSRLRTTKIREKKR